MVGIRVISGHSPELLGRRSAALCEVLEKAGCEAKIINYAGSTYDTYGDIEKLVVFWNMEAVGASAFQASEEV